MEKLDGSIQLMAGDEPLELRELNLACTMAGGSAECTVDMTFFNPYSHKNLEGELDLPLPEDAVVCGYSLEFEGHMVPASIVEKEKARVTFEKEARDGGTTALVEHVKGNSFKVRVYPLAPNEPKRISLTFIVELKSGESGLLLPLPFVVPQPIKKLDVSVAVQGVEAEPTVIGGPPGLRFSTFGKGGHRAVISLKDTPMNEPITVQMSLPKERTQTYVSTRDFGYHGTETFFVVDDSPVAQTESTTQASYKRCGIVWDASYSMNSVDRSRELNIIASLVQLFDEFVVMVFRNTVDPERVFSKKEVDDLIAYLRDEVICDGGTDMQHLRFPDCDKILWFTDGLSTLSGDQPAQLPSSPVYAVVSAAKCNSKSLSQFCNKTGGSCFILASISDDEGIVQEIVKSSQFQLVGVAIVEGEVDSILPSNPLPLFSGQKVRIAGRLLASSSKITLNYGYSQHHIVESHTVALLKESAVKDSDLIPRIWGNKKVDELSPEEDKDELIKIGRKFGIVTPGASLLVLTTLEQYLKHKIKPSKEALPAVYDAWQSRVNKEEREKAENIIAKLEKVKGWWNTRRQWHAQDHTSALENHYRRVWEREQGFTGSSSDKAPSRRMGKKKMKKEEEKLDKLCGMEMEFSKKKCKKAASKPSAGRGGGPPPKPCAPCMKSMAAPCPPPPCGGGPPPGAAMAFGLSMNAAPPPPCCASAAPAAPEPVAAEAADTGSASASMSLKSWLPDKPYLKEIQKKQGSKLQYLEYIYQRKQNGSSPAFFLDVCHYFCQNPETRDLGVRVITTLADMKLEDHRLLRILAHKLLEEGMLEQSLWLFERVLQLRSEEPQSLREVALVHLEKGEFQKAIDLLWEVVIKDWPTRFQHIEDEVLLQLNRAVWLAGLKEITVDLKDIPVEFHQVMPMDIHCTITWDTDDTCIDLHIKEPTGVNCCYSHHVTDIGGFSTPDYSGCTAYSTSMLREYMIKNAMPGQYTLGCNYYSNYRQDLTGGTAIWFTVYTNWCSDKEEKMVTALRLEVNSASPNSSSEYTIGTVAYGESLLVERLIDKWEKEWNAKGKKTKRQLEK